MLRGGFGINMTLESIYKRLVYTEKDHALLIHTCKTIPHGEYPIEKPLLQHQYPMPQNPPSV
jgi:hypothetical protein